jgi:amino acid permease
MEINNLVTKQSSSKLYPYEKENPDIIRENLLYEKEDRRRESTSEEEKNDDLINDQFNSDEASDNKDLLRATLEDVPNRENRNCLDRWFHKISGGSLRGSIFAVASVSFGGGCLAFPAAIAKVGPFIGFLIFCFSAYVSYLTVVYLVETGIKRKIHDYNELVVQAIGNKWRIFADINNIVLCFGVIMSYQYMVYEFLQIVLNQLFGIETNDLNKLIIVLICCFGIQIPLSLLKNVSILQYASLTATVSLCYCIVVIIIETPYYFQQNYGTSEEFKLSWTNPNGIGWNWLNCLSTFLFGFCVHNGLFQVFMEMDRPNLRRSMKVVNRATIIEIVLYFSISFGGFFSMYYKSPDVYLKRPDLIGFNDYFMLIAKIALIVVLNCCGAINYNIMRLSVRSMVFDNQIPSFWTDFAITVVVYIVSNTITFFVKDASTLLGFVGGISTVVISFACPILIRIYLGTYEKGSWKIYLNYVFLGVMCLAGVACTVKAVVDYIQQI